MTGGHRPRPGHGLERPPRGRMRQIRAAPVASEIQMIAWRPPAPRFSTPRQYRRWRSGVRYRTAIRSTFRVARCPISRTAVRSMPRRCRCCGTACSGTRRRAAVFSSLLRQETLSQRAMLRPPLADDRAGTPATMSNGATSAFTRLAAPTQALAPIANTRQQDAAGTDQGMGMNSDRSIRRVTIRIRNGGVGHGGAAVVVAQREDQAAGGDRGEIANLHFGLPSIAE